MADTISILNDLMAVHYRSLPMYLTVATPWTHRGDEKAVQVVKDIVEDHQAASRRLAKFITARGAIVETGEYPIELADTHFLSLDFLIRQLITAQQHDVDNIGLCVEQLWNDPPAQTIAKELLGSAKGHLQSLDELVAESPKAP